MTEIQLTLAILVPEGILLSWFFARAIGWKPRHRWESEVNTKTLESRLSQLELRLELLENRLRAPSAAR